MNMFDFLQYDLKKSGLTPEDISGVEVCADGYLIPFYKTDSKELMKNLKGDAFIRKRLAFPKEGSPKYLSELGAGIRCYILPRVHRYLSESPSAPLFLTEGEKKAAKGTKEGLATIGLVGIWGWLESKEKRTKGEYTINGDITTYLGSPRPVYIIFDSDCTSANKSSDFDNCAQKLATELKRYQCPLYRLNLPAGQNGTKQGLDDFFVGGGTLDELKVLIKHAELVTGEQVIFTSDTAWCTPGDLQSPLAPLATCPLHALPSRLKIITESISSSFNIPDEMTIATLLGMLSIAIGNKSRVFIKGTDHRQFANLFFMIAAPVSAGKSPLAKEIQAPLVEIQKTARSKWEEEFEHYKIRASVIEDQIKELRQPNSKGAKDIEAVTKQIIALKKTQKTPPIEPVYFMDDTTSEALARKMKSSGGCIGVFSGEARKLISIACGKYGGSEDIDLWLKGHSGDYLKVERIGRESIEIPEACISAVVMTQPDSLKTMGKHASMLESGFLARWLYIVPDITPGAYPIAEISREIRQEYKDLIEKLLSSKSFREVKLSKDAFALWRAYHDREKILIYNAQKDNNLLLAQWISKLPEHIARLSLIFHIVQNQEGHLETELMKKAIEWGDFFKSHARRAFSTMENSKDFSEVLRVWTWLNSKRDILSESREKEGLGKIEAVKARDIARHGVANIHSTEHAGKILSHLEGKGYLNSRRIKKRGCVEQVIYEIIPSAFLQSQPDKADNPKF